MKRIALAAITLAIGLGSFAQTADEVIGAYITACGGLDKMKSIKSVYMTTVSVMQNGNETTSKIWKVQDKLYRRELELPFGNMTLLVTDKEGWRSNPRNGGAFEAMDENFLKALQSELDCAGPLADYAAKGHKAEYLGKETVDGVECDKVKLTLKSGSEIVYYFDSKTHLIVQDVRKLNMMAGRPGGGGGGNPQGGGGPREQITKYSDYQKIDGYLFPMKTSGGFGGATTIETIEVNKTVDPKLYKAE